MILVFSLSALWWRRIRGLWKLPDVIDWLRGILGLFLMGGAMLSKSLIFCWWVEPCSLPAMFPPCCVPFLLYTKRSIQFSSVQLPSCVRLFSTSWIAVRQASLSTTNSRSSLRLILTTSNNYEIPSWGRGDNKNESRILLENKRCVYLCVCVCVCVVVVGGYTYQD